MIKQDFNFFTQSILSQLFPSNIELMPNVDDIFELDFALGELSVLTNSELINRSGFIGKVNGIETNHYKIGLSSSLDVYSKKSIRTKSFFTKGKFSTGYAVHGLFPYRGKFHAQLVKGILNVIGIGPGDTLLDPMMGSGTACIEAQLIGANGIGFDISPFCVLMATAKSRALCSSTQSLIKASQNYEKTIQYIEEHKTDLLTDAFMQSERIIVVLAYLDAMGYARRVLGQKTADKFPEVLSRYENTISTFSKIRDELNLSLGQSNYQIGDSRNLPINDNSVDGIVTSPPYSFAIDYIENDLPQLDFLGIETNQLRNELMGLRGGKRKTERISIYLEDLNLMIKEMSRVLKVGKCCVIIIGSNEIQTGGIRFEESVKAFASIYNFELLKELIKPIRGIQNSMTDEYVLFFRKVRD